MPSFISVAYHSHDQIDSLKQSTYIKLWDVRNSKAQPRSKLKGSYP